MATLLYLHGFLSSPASHKAVQVGQWLAAHRPDLTYVCPQLSPYPGQTRDQLQTLLAAQAGPVYVMGSSLGGFWASWLVEHHDVRALLINPSVNPQRLLPDYLHQPLRNYHTSDTYLLTKAHLQEMQDLAGFAIARPENYWLLLQTGDETLDYRQAVARYRHCKQTVEAGGDHSFQGFERYIAPALAFLEGKNAEIRHV